MSDPSGSPAPGDRAGQDAGDILTAKCFADLRPDSHPALEISDPAVLDSPALAELQTRPSDGTHLCG